MKLRILGTRGEIKSSAPRHSKHSGVLIDGKLMLDVGEKEFLDLKPGCVFITHLHPDHAFFINDGHDYGIEFYAPEKVPGVTHLTEPEHMILYDTYQVIPIPTNHSKKVKSTAFLVDDGEKRVLYTGDVIWINKEYYSLLSGLSLVITDGSYLRRGGMIRKDKETGQLYGHAGIPDLIRIFKQFTGKIMFIHFGTWFFNDIGEARKKLNDLGKAAGVSIITGYDGMEIEC
jgi:ribonuclease BN (tRNA processing enzyme)